MEWGSDRGGGQNLQGLWLISLESLGSLQWATPSYVRNTKVTETCPKRSSWSDYRIVEYNASSDSVSNGFYSLIHVLARKRLFLHRAQSTSRHKSRKLNGRGAKKSRWKTGDGFFVWTLSISMFVGCKANGEWQRILPLVGQKNIYTYVEPYKVNLPADYLRGTKEKTSVRSSECEVFNGQAAVKSVLREFLEAVFLAKMWSKCMWLAGGIPNEIWMTKRREVEFWLICPEAVKGKDNVFLFLFSPNVVLINLNWGKQFEFQQGHE